MYAYVQNGGVVRFLLTLPQKWAEAENFDELTDAQRIVYGVFPVVDFTSSPYPEGYWMRGARQINVLPDRVEITDEVVPISLELAKQKKRAEINSRVEFYAAQGVQAQGITFSLAPDARLLLMGIQTHLSSGGALPANFTWRDINDNAVPLNAAQVTALYQIILQRWYTIWNTAAGLRDQLAAATTVAQVAAIAVP